MKNLLVIALSIFIFSSANAANIHFDVDGFVGAYQIDSGPSYIGDQTLSISAGSHTLTMMSGGTVGFTVNLDDSVTSGDLVVMSHSGSTLTFNNVEVEFDIGQYSYFYAICRSSFLSASNTYRLPPGIDLSINVPPYQDVAVFSVATNGDVTLDSGEDLFDVEDNLITFKPIKITIDPQNYIGPYSLYVKPFIHGIHEVYLLPDTYYTITNDATLLGDINTNLTGLDLYSNNYIKAEGDRVTLYQNRFVVTPPSGYTDYWRFYGNDAFIGPHGVWLVRGGLTSINAGNVQYNVSVTSDCSPFTISTAVGTFNVACDNDASLYDGRLDEDKFNDIDFGYLLQRYDGRFSTSIADYELSVNGDDFNLSGATLTKDTLHAEGAFVQGRNEILLEGEDEDANTFEFSKTYWAGGAEVTVNTQGATDTVTLTVEQTIDGSVYTHSVTQVAASNTTVFTNIPQITNGVVYISTTRGLKKLTRKLPKKTVVHL